MRKFIFYFIILVAIPFCMAVGGGLFNAFIYALLPGKFMATLVVSINVTILFYLGINYHRFNERSMYYDIFFITPCLFLLLSTAIFSLNMIFVTNYWFKYIIAATIAVLYITLLISLGSRIHQKLEGQLSSNKSKMLSAILIPVTLGTLSLLFNIPLAAFSAHM